jgi:hypothetical protein
MQDLKRLKFNLYTRKCHNETSCIAILNKQKMSFFKSREQKGKIDPVWQLVPVGRVGYKERV